MPKYMGKDKRKAHSKDCMNPATSREEASKRKLLMYIGTCPLGHNSQIRTQSGRCRTCEKLRLYEKGTAQVVSSH